MITVYASWHGFSGKFTTSTEDYERQWALEGPSRAGPLPPGIMVLGGPGMALGAGFTIEPKVTWP